MNLSYESSPSPPPARVGLAVALAVVLVLPWLNPFAPGPTSQVVQSLLSLSCLALLLMLYCLWLLFRGSYDQAMVNLTSTSAVMEIPLAWLYGSGMVLAVLGAPILLSDLWRLLNGQIDEDHLLLMQDSEESPHVGGADRH